MAVLPFCAMFLVVLKGFIYAIAVYIYACRLEIRSILPCVLQQIALRFAAFYLAFSGKTHCI